MRIKRARVVPEGTSRAIMLENIIADVVLFPNPKNEKEIVFFRVAEKELADSTFDYLLDEDVAKHNRLLNNDKVDIATECKHFEPLVIGKKFKSCAYCRGSRDCEGFISSKKRKKEYKG